MEESIHDAVRSGQIQRVWIILKRNSSCVNDLDADFKSPLHVIYDHVNPFDENHQADERLPIMRMLIDYGADVNIRGVDCITPLLSAIQKHQINGVKMLLENKADPNVRDNFNRTALMDAIVKGIHYNKDSKIIELLLDYKADHDLNDTYGDTALDYAISYKKSDYVEILLAFGMSIDSNDLIDFFFVHSAKIKNIYRTFLKKVRVVNIFRLPDEDYLMLQDVLLSHTSQIIERGQFSITHLGYYNKVLIENKNKRALTLLELLRSQGVDVRLIGSGDSNLHKAVRDGNMMLVKVVLEKEKTKVNATNYFCDTPLHVIFNRTDRTSFIDIGCLLLSAGADWRAPNLIDETPFYLAVNNKAAKLVELMLGKIARVDDLMLECNVTKLPTLEISYTENDVALDEFLVAICLDCEPVIERLLDEDYNIDVASKHYRRDITVILAKAVQLNKYILVKKLLEADFRTNGCFSGDLIDLHINKGDKIGISCLLWEFKDRSTLNKLMYDIVNHFLSSSCPDVLIYQLLYYYVIDNHVKKTVTNLIKLPAPLKLQTLLRAKIDECENDLLKMKNIKFAGVSVFDIMTMELDSFVRLLNREELFDSCVEKVLELENLNELKYYDVALQFRLRIALEKNRIFTIARYQFHDILDNCSNGMICLPYLIVQKIFSDLNVRDLKKMTE